MKVYAFDVEFNLRNKQGGLLENHNVTLKLQRNTGFFLEDDEEGLLNGTIVQTKAFVSSAIGRVIARLYFKTPESIQFIQDIISADVISVTPVTLEDNLLSLNFDDEIMVGDTVDFTIKSVDANLNAISETIDILVDGTYYDSIQTTLLGDAVYKYNNTSTVGSQSISIECVNADTQTKELVITDESI